jgi:hypothetical protein
MLNFPIFSGTFKRSFLGGDGQLEVASDQDAWKALVASGAPFDRSVDRVADLKVTLGTEKALMLGRADTLKIGISASAEVVHQIQLIWPDSQTDPSTTRDLAPGTDELLVRLLFQGKADASAKGSAPIGPLKATFGLTAGGSLSYERLRIVSATTPARKVLSELFSGLRLPQQVDAVGEIPEPGEVVVTKFGGYLNLTGQVSYGYSLTGSRDIEIGKLNLDLDYALKLSAGLSAAYSLAGEFELEARAGSTPNFVRYVVRKSRDSQFNFAADFGLDAKLHLKGLPDTADEFLEKVFGAPAERALKLFGKARTYTSVEELEKAAGKVLKGTIHNLSQKLIGKALTNATLNEFLTRMLQVVDTYNSIDTRIIHLYEDFLDKIPQLTATLNLLAKVSSRDGLKDISDNQTWVLITRLAGPGLHDILMEDPAFAEFATLVQQIKSFIEDGAKQEIREVVATFKAAFPLDSVLSQLRGIKKPDQLKDLADEKLQGLAEQILGKAFNEIRASDVGKALKEIHAALDQVETFKKKYYDKLKEVANRSFTAQLHFAYSRASSRTALLDVEVDVSTEKGSQLARLAAGGDFADLLANYNSKLVRINKGVFTHSISSSTQVQINLFGFAIGGLTQVLQNTEEALEAHDGGLLHIYTTKTQIEERRKHGGELTASTFLFATIAKAFQAEGSREYLVRTLPKMSVQYDLLKEDDKTKPDEMRQILELAALVGILPDTTRFLDQLRNEFPKGLGKVSARYVIRYDSDAVAVAFQLPDGENRENLRRLGRETVRQHIAARFTSLRSTEGMALLGFAYLDSALFESFVRLGFAAFAQSDVLVTLPPWFTKASAQSVRLQNSLKQVLITLYNIENTFLNRLVQLDSTIDALRDERGGISADRLNKQVKEFMQMSDDLNQFRENAFFTVFDRLVHEGSGGKVPRNSSLVLDITPPGGQKVTKVLTAVKPALQASEVPAVAGATFPPPEGTEARTRSGGIPGDRSLASIPRGGRKRRSRR